jgi:hypothetical protein
MGELLNQENPLVQNNAIVGRGGFDETVPLLGGPAEICCKRFLHVRLCL